MALFILEPAFTTVVNTAGLSVKIADTTMGIKGGVIINPLSAKDQGLAVAESLYVNLLGSAGVPAPGGLIPGNTEITPGQWFLVPPQSNVWVNAASAGHQFTAFFSSEYTVPYPPAIVPGQPTGPITGGSDEVAISAEPGQVPFPPLNVTGLTNVIPSYLYQQYTDDDDLQGFVAAQNISQQDYIDTFNALNLPIYTGPIVQGALLDWVARGLYGISRPSLGPKNLNLFGPVNTYGMNWLVPMWDQFDAAEDTPFGLNMLGVYGPIQVYLTDDDTYRRIITWHFYKADGNYCSVEFMKRRVWRFLFCLDGTSTDWAVDPATGRQHSSGFSDADDDFIADTRQISITFGVNRNITIRFVLGNRTVKGGAMTNMFGCNGFEVTQGKVPPWDIGIDSGPGPTGTPKPAGIMLNDLETTYVPLPPLPFMRTFKEALDLGVLEVPYQFNFTCVIG